MASAVYSESPVYNDRRPLSICLDVPPSSSPFPSPSSSFLPPPTPGAHEFAVKPPPAGRNSRKTSLVQREDEGSLQELATTASSQKPQHFEPNGSTPSDIQETTTLSPITPTPPASQRESTMTNGVLPPSSHSTTTPTHPTVSLPQADDPTTPLPAASESTAGRSNVLVQIPKTPSTPSTPSCYPPSPSGFPPDLTPNRPAPPSPAVSRRVSATPSTYSTRSRSSRSSRPPSTAVSRTNSTRKHDSSHSPSHNSNRLSAQYIINKITKSVRNSVSSPLPSPGASSGTCAFVPPSVAGVSSAVAPAPAVSIERTLIHVRDFAYSAQDVRFSGLGPDVPRPNRVSTLNRRLRGGSDSDDDDDMDDEDGGFGDAWDMLRAGVGKLTSWRTDDSRGSNRGEGGPSQEDLNINFGGEGEEEEDEEEEAYYDAEGDEEPLYPGLYKALYAFEPEGTAEMGLEEDQIVRVVGRGGGIGWAIVIDDREGTPDKHALVPESYLEVVKLDRLE